MSAYSRASWRDYPVRLIWPSGKVSTGYVRATSHRDAEWRAGQRWDCFVPQGLTYTVQSPS